VRRYRAHIFVLSVLAVIVSTGLHQWLVHALTDVRFRWLTRPATGEIVLVAIDSRSIDTLAAWPWPRHLHAQLIRNLVGAGATDIVFDVDFSSPSTPESDTAFADALRDAGGSIVLPAFRQSGGSGAGAVHYNRPLPQFERHVWAAIVNVGVEADGLVRRYALGDTLDGQFLPSMGALLAGNYDPAAKPFWIDFGIKADTLPSLSYVDVLRGDAAALRSVAGKKVIVGAMALELGDRFSVPNGRVIPGPQLQMLEAESILQHRMLRTGSDLTVVAGIGLLILGMAATWRRIPPVGAIAVLVCAALLGELAAVLVQARFAVIIDTSLWHITIAAYFAALALDQIDLGTLLRGIAEKRFQQIAMSLGDGLVCADQHGLVTVWNPGAEAIFGYQAGEMLGRALDGICFSVDQSGTHRPFRVTDVAAEVLQAPGGKLVELRGRRKTGEEFPLEACLSGWHGIDGFQYGAVVRDISVRTREAERIRYLAEHDTLTDLANRNALHERFQMHLAEAAAQGGEIGVLLMDLDKFKQINDTLGHAYGDRLLQSVAQRLGGLCAGTDIVARMSGDEFAVVVCGSEAVARAEQLAVRISADFAKEPFQLRERHVRINVSVGVASYPRHGQTAEELFGNADLALYRAKSAGRSRAIVFEHALRTELEARVALEADLSLAVDRNELELFFQPQVRIRDRMLVGAEALIRWRHPRRGLVPPSEFMPLVNASTFSDRIAYWVLETACRQGGVWQQKGFDVRIGVNLSPSQLRSGHLADAVAATLRDTGFAPSLLELEVTENILLDDHQDALETFGRLKQSGVRLAFDDFGTGYASLSYLRRYPLDRLKIDQSFVRSLVGNASNAAIVRSIIGLGRTLGMSVIAEGIEDPGVADFLARMGCDEGQGFLYGHPVTAQEFERVFLRADAGPPSTSSQPAPAVCAA
jgi:diguanylate cyclase (GGDEF)-like protein/PAS domain S-box-containing protein